MKMETELDKNTTACIYFPTPSLTHTITTIMGYL